MTHDGLIDLNDAHVIPKGYGGANGGKICVEHGGEQYMIKYPAHARVNSNLSYAHGCVSEYLGCHVFQSVGIPAQETFLGMRRTVDGKDSLVVACKDLTQNDSLILQDFGTLKNTTIAGTPQSGYGTELSEVLASFQLQDMLNPEELSNRFWDMFVVDAFIGNWDRHNGNWGFLYDPKTKTLELAPVYDCGSCLYALADDKTMRDTLAKQDELDFRIYERPMSALCINGKKIKYFDFMSSLENEDCNAALKRIVPRIDMNTISRIIEYTPCISDLHKEFYDGMLWTRKERILDFSLNKLRERDSQGGVKQRNTPESSCPYKNGESVDKTYLELGLPDRLQEAIDAMQAAWEKLDAGEEYSLWDGDFCTLQSEINVAEVGNIISSEQASYLREKYLRYDLDEI